MFGMLDELVFWRSFVRYSIEQDIVKVRKDETELSINKK